MSYERSWEEYFRFLGTDFLKELKEFSLVEHFEAKTELIEEGQKVKYIPIIISGLVKVYSMNEEKELLYYFMKPGQSCIATFSAVFKDGRSRVFACTEEASEILLLPSNHVLRWVTQYPDFNRFFYAEYDMRYTEIMESVNKVIYHRLDRRIMDYLENRTKITGKTHLKISHKEIANSLGTAREVVSRILKKFEQEGYIQHNSFGIEVLKTL